jgi:hypothetical protein
VLALAGCSQNDKDPAGPRTAPSAGAASSPVAAANGELAIPQDAAETARQEYVYQNALASCMRAKGFTYTAHVTDYKAMNSGPDGEDYDLAKKFREKYGYGKYAAAVYPNDPNVPGTDAFAQRYESNPDEAYLNALPPAQRKAYDQAMGDVRLVNGEKQQTPGCRKDARLKAYGPLKSKAEMAREGDAFTARDREAKQALDGDPQLISLAQEFASCLRGEGIAVTTTQPTSIGDMVKFQVMQTPVDDMQNMDQETARAKLSQEISTALKDLECGKKFRAAYFPKLAEHPYAGGVG